MVRLTKYGWPQVVVFPAVVIAFIIVCPLVTARVLPTWVTYSIEAVLSVILVWVLVFFRDPYRLCPQDKNLLLSPADGRITDIETVESQMANGDKRLATSDKLAGATLRIGIFLSIFDVHINRAPCNVKVEGITYKKGRYKIACYPQSGRVNESNELQLIRTDSPKDRLIVRQISGAIARRIVCDARQGQELSGGEKFGMIKFGSRTELHVPAGENIKCLVKIDDKVKAGITPLVRYTRISELVEQPIN
jgi:phosphatidylserine decarboxylase